MSEEIKYIPTEITGAFKNKKNRKNYKLSGILNTVDLPKQSFCIQEAFPPNNQLSRPSCTAQAQCHHKERQEKEQGSARFIMALTKELEGNKKEGAYGKNTFKIVKDYGVPPESMYPEPDDSVSWEEYIDTSKIPPKCYDEAFKHRSGSYWELENNIDFLRQTLAKYKNSVNIAMAWYKEFNSNSIGKEAILPLSFSNYVGGHEVDVIGFDDFKQLVKIRNSWSENWGQNGYFYMPYELLDKIVWDMWTSLDIEEELPVNNRYGKKRTWCSFLMEQKTAFNPWLYKKIKRLPSNREINALWYGKHNFETVFKGINGDVWLYKTKIQLIKEKFNYKIYV